MTITEELDGRTCFVYSGRNIENEVLIAYDTCRPSVSKNLYTPPPIWIRKIQRYIKKRIGKAAVMPVMVGIPTVVLLFVGLVLRHYYTRKRIKEKQT